MSNRHGAPIWYELMTKDPSTARRFYSAVVGWQIDEFAPADSTTEYRLISASDGVGSSRGAVLRDARLQQ